MNRDLESPIRPTPFNLHTNPRVKDVGTRWTQTIKGWYPTVLIITRSIDPIWQRWLHYKWYCIRIHMWKYIMLYKICVELVIVVRVSITDLKMNFMRWYKVWKGSISCSEFQHTIFKISNILYKKLFWETTILSLFWIFQFIYI